MNVEYHIISLQNSHDRIQNIETIQNKIQQKLHIFPAIDGNQIDFNSQNDVNIKYRYKYKGEIGCFLSHYYLLKSLVNSDCDYHVIFEDDAQILCDNLHEQIIATVNENFDFFFLGYLTKCLYSKRQTVHHHYGTHGYIVNTKSIPKILDLLSNAYSEIDIQIFRACSSKQYQISGHFFKPFLVGICNFKSQIRYNSILPSKLKEPHKLNKVHKDQLFRFKKLKK